MRIIARKTFVNAWTAIDAETYVDINSPTGLGASRDAAIEDLLNQLPDSHENHSSQNTKDESS